MQTENLKDNNRSSFFSRVIGSFVSPLYSPIRSASSRWFHSWAGLKEKIARLEEYDVEGMEPVKAEREYRDLCQIFAWHLKQPVSRIEQVQLIMALGRLRFRVGLLEQVMERERQAYLGLKAINDTLDAQKRYELRRCLVSLQISLAKVCVERGEDSKAVYYADKAISSHVLSQEEWQTVVAIVLRYREQNKRTYSIYLLYLANCKTFGGKIEDAALEELKRSVQISDDACISKKDEAIRRLHQLHLVIPSLHWPAVMLAEADVRAERIKSAEHKLHSVYAHVDGELKAQCSFLLGQVAYYNEQYNEADGYFDDALAGGSSPANVLEFVGMAKANVGDFETALSYIERAERADPNDMYLMLQKANILLCLGRLEESRKQFERILSKYPEHIEARFGLAKILEMQGHLSKAANLYEQIIADDGRSVQAHYSLGVVLLDRGQRNQGYVCLEDVLKIDPNHLPSLQELGILIVQEAIESAAHESGLKTGIQYLKQCEKARYDEERTAYWLGRALTLKNEFAKCLGQWELLEERWSANEDFGLQIDAVRCYQAQDLISRGQLQEAISLLDRLHTRTHDVFAEDLRCALRLELARSAIHEGQHEKATEKIEELLSVQPINAYAHLVLALLKLTKGELTMGALTAIVDQMPEGSERNACRFLCWLYDRRLAFHKIDQESVWDHVSRDELPPFVQDVPEFRLFAFVHDAAVENGNGMPAAKDLEEIVTLIENGGRPEIFDRAEFAWWLAKVILWVGNGASYIQRLSLHQRKPEDFTFRLTAGLVNLYSKNMDEGVKQIKCSMDKVDQELREHIGRAICCCAYNKIAQIRKRPECIQEATKLLETACDIWRTAA